MEFLEVLSTSLIISSIILNQLIWSNLEGRDLTRAIIAVKFCKRRRVAGAAVIIDGVYSTLTRFVNNFKGASK